MLFYLIGHSQTKPGFAFVFVRVTPTQQEVHRRKKTQNKLSKWQLLEAKTTQVVQRFREILVS